MGREGRPFFGNPTAHTHPKWRTRSQDRPEAVSNGEARSTRARLLPPTPSPVRQRRRSGVGAGLGRQRCDGSGSLHGRGHKTPKRQSSPHPPCSALVSEAAQLRTSECAFAADRGGLAGQQSQKQPPRSHTTPPRSHTTHPPSLHEATASTHPRRSGDLDRGADVDASQERERRQSPFATKVEHPSTTSNESPRALAPGLGVSATKRKTRRARAPIGI